MTLSRRWFMLGGGALGASVALMSSEPAEASPTGGRAPSTVDLTPHTTTTYLFDPAYTAAIPYDELFAVSIAGHAQTIGGSEIEILYDARVVAPADSVSTVTWRETSTRRPAVSGNGQSSESLSIRLPDTDVLADGADVIVNVSIPLNRIASYPKDSVDSPRPTILRLRDNANVVIAEVDLAAEKGPNVPGSVWGASVAAVWDAFPLHGAQSPDRYSYPAFVRLDSIGPAEVPIGTTIGLVIDSGLAVLDITDVFAGDRTGEAFDVRKSTSSDGSARTITLVLRQPIPVGTALSIATAVTPVRLESTPRDVSYARVWIAGATTLAPLQRVTGAEAASAVTASGNPRATSPFTSKI